MVNKSTSYDYLCNNAPARVFNPTHVNRRRELFDKALALAGRGCTVDVTAYPVRDADLVVLGEDASVRHVMAGGRWHVLDGEVMIHSTIRATIQEPNP